MENQQTKKYESRETTIKGKRTNGNWINNSYNTTRMEQLKIVLGLVGFLAATIIVGNLIYNRWTKEKEKDENFNQKQYDDLNDEHFGDLMYK